MRRALIGHTGFVGGTLLRTGAFTDGFNSTNFRDMAGQLFDEVVCAGIPSVKYLANRDPEQDWARISALLTVLQRTPARRFVLISTIDVYPDPSAPLDEDAELEGLPNQPYGSHRLAVERFVDRHFRDSIVIRLPALFGEGLKKNALFDLLHDNMVDKINPAAVFQWYPLRRLPADLQIAVDAGLHVVNLFTEPLPMRDLIQRYFPDARVAPGRQPAPRYDLSTKHAALFGGCGRHIMTAAQVTSELGAFIRGVRRQ